MVEALRCKRPGNTRRYASLTRLPIQHLLLDMRPFTEQLIEYIDRILWATRMASLTSPTLWGRCERCGETFPWTTSIRQAETSCTRCGHEDPHYASA